MTCKELAELIGTGERQPFLKRLEMRFHALICRACSNYVEQMKLINQRYIQAYKDFEKHNQNKIENVEKECLKRFLD